MEILVIETSRDAYCKRDVVKHTMTAGELRELLDRYDDETPVILSFDNGYTYGKINSYYIREDEIDPENNDE